MREDIPEFHYESDLYKRNPSEYEPANGKVIKDDDAVLEMKFISQPQTTQIEDLATFEFKDYAGSGITVYVHDTGINLQHPEFTTPVPWVTRGTHEWLYPKGSEITGLFGKVIPHPTEDEPSGHGTCVADKVVGTHFGVAKGASLKVVPFIEEVINFSYLLAGLQAIVDDMKRQRKTDREKGYFPVVNLSYRLNELSDRDIEKYRKFLKVMVAFDAVIVGAAGNRRLQGVEGVEQYPAKFVEEYAFKENMIITGAVDMLGHQAIFSQGGPLVEIWAPGTRDSTNGLECAGATGEGTVLKKGTSYAAPQVSGLVAYLYSLYPGLRTPGSAAPKVLAKLKQLAYPRFGGGPKSVWNGAYGQVYCT